MLVVTPKTPETRPAGKKLTHADVIAHAQSAFGGSNADGTFTAADAFDVLQFHVHNLIHEHPARYDPTCGVVQARRVAADVKTLLDRLPAQARRDAETDALQQFSTPPHYSYLGAWVARLSDRDAVLEPSAGTASFVVHAMNAGCEVWANELSERRGKLLAGLLPAGFVFAENAEQLDNVLPEHVAPTVILMNPPFTVSAHRPGEKVPAAACLHVEQALRRLADGGRLVAVLPATMGPDRARFADWWARLRAAYNVRCNVGIPGDEYKKYGTTVDTRLVVIDKDGPTVDAILTADLPNVDAAFAALEPVRASRPAVKARTRAADVVAAKAPQLGLFGALDLTSRKAVPRSTAASYEPASRVIAADELKLAEPEATSDPLSAVLQAAARATRIFTDATFEPYYPQRLRVEGAQPHPTPLVESAAMASVEPPAPTYAPSLPFALVADGVLSDAQLESVVYAGQAHRQYLEPQDLRSPFTGEDRPVRVRKGFFIGDGTGVGKGRELSAIVLDSFARGTRKALWLTKSPDLIRDAIRDWTDLGGRKDEIIDLGKIKAGQKLTANRGILFGTYGLLKQDMEDKKGRCRFKQIVKWLGGDAFDGVIGFDEAHAMQNAMMQQGKRGKKKPSQTAVAGCNLQDACANAKVVYLSATGATEVSNLAYCHRLGLWGKGTAFPTKQNFVAQVDAGGVAAMELVARDLKQRGLYLSRGLSFDGVGYERLTHVLTPDQRAIYNKLCQGWRVVLSNFDKALELTASAPNDSGRMVVDGKAKGRAYGRFWGAHQRFFNQILTAMQMPSVLDDIERHLAAGDAAVLQIVNTNEASMDRQLAKLGEGDDLDNIDLTPRDQIMQLIQHCFPVTQMEPEPDGKGMRVCRDSEGNPVINRTAVAMRERLLAEMSTISCPDGPLEMLVNHFGPKRVAEVTGRSRRVVRWRVDGVEKTYPEGRSPIKAMAEAAEFQDGERDVLVFSDAGGTGKSYHDSNKNRVRRRRVHWLIQAGWVAANAVQGFGRTHRSNQASAPLFKLVSTDLKGQKRFISTIARRLDQLGALTKGQRQAATQGMFAAADNLESQHARDALYMLYRDLVDGKVAGLSYEDFKHQTCLELTDPDDNTMLEELPPVTKFLNRLLSMEIEQQNRLFDAYAERIELKIKLAMEAGTFDLGVETIRADRVTKLGDQVVFTDPASGAETKHVELKLEHKADPLGFDELIANESTDAVNATFGRGVQFFARNIRSGRVYGFFHCGERTMPNGSLVDHFYKVGPHGRDVIPKSEIARTDHWQRLSPRAAKPIWDDHVRTLPPFVERTVHLITGAVLPIWDRLPKDQARVYRLQTDDGERLLGRVVPEESIQTVLARLGVTGRARTYTPADVVNLLAGGKHKVELTNGWVLRATKIDREPRYELIGPTFVHHDDVTGDGVFFERINWQGRYFVPTGTEAAGVVERLVKHRPVSNVVGIERAA